MRHDSTHPVLALLDVLYAAVLDNSRWAEFVKGLADTTRSAQAALFYADTASQAIAIHGTWGFSDEERKVYPEHFLSTDVWLQSYLRNGCAGAVPSHDLFPPERLIDTEFYYDYLRVFDKYHQCGCSLGGSNYLTLIRPKRARKYEPNHVRLVNCLLPHLANAAKLSSERALLRGIAEASECVAASEGSGIMLLSRKGTIIHVNHGAHNLLRSSHELSLSANGLHARSARTNAALQGLIAAAVQTGIGTGALPGGSIAVPRTDRLPLFVTVTPMTSASNPALGTAAIILLKDPQAVPKRPAEIFQQVFGLTEAEARLASLLAQAKSMAEAAAELSLSRNTIKTQTKSIYSKAGLTTQAQLVALAARMGIL